MTNEEIKYQEGYGRAVEEIKRYAGSPWPGFTTREKLQLILEKIDDMKRCDHDLH